MSNYPENLEKHSLAKSGSGKAVIHLAPPPQAAAKSFTNAAATGESNPSASTESKPSLSPNAISTHNTSMPVRGGRSFSMLNLSSPIAPPACSPNSNNMIDAPSYLPNESRFEEKKERSRSVHISDLRVDPSKGKDEFTVLLEAARAAGNEDDEMVRAKRGCVFACFRDPCARAKTAGIVLFVLAGIAISIVLYYSLRNKELAQWRDSFVSQCEQRAQLVNEQLRTASTKVESFRGLMAALLVAPNVTQYNTTVRGWAQRVTGPIRTRSPEMDELFCTQQQLEFFSNASNISGALDYVMFLRYVQNEERVLYERTYTDIRYRPTRINSTLNLSWQYSPVTDYYLPLQMSDPRYPIGFDLTGWDFRSLTILPNLTKLLEVNVAMASGRSSTLFQSRGSYGILVSLPVISDLSANTMAEKLNHLVGIITAIIPVNKLLSEAVASFDQPIQVTLLDPETINLNYTYLGAANLQSHTNGGENATVVLPYALHNYQLVCTPSSSYVEDALSWYPTWIALGTAILFALQIIAVVLGSSCQELQKVVRRSEALAAANQSKNWAIDQLERARLAADIANASKTDFMAFLCHELRNPLHAIVSMLEFVSHPGLAPDDLESLATVKHSVNMMRSIVNDALDMTKIESGNITFESVPFSLREIVQTLWRVEQSHARAKGLDLALHMDDRIPTAFYGDPTRLRQVIMNFLTNAIKFTKQGSVSIHLRIMSNDEANNNVIGYPQMPTTTPQTLVPSPPAAFPSAHSSLPVAAPSAKHVSPAKDNNANIGSQVAVGIPQRVTTSTVELPERSPAITAASIILEATPPITNTPYQLSQQKPVLIDSLPATIEFLPLELMVADTGMGIEPELIPRLFEPYSQAKLSIMRDHGGTGLGLAIVARIVRLMGGHVFVESIVGSGSSFKAQFRLPVAPAGIPLVSLGIDAGGSVTTSLATRRGMSPRGTSGSSSSSSGSSDEDLAPLHVHHSHHHQHHHHHHHHHQPKSELLPPLQQQVLDRLFALEKQQQTLPLATTAPKAQQASLHQDVTPYVSLGSPPTTPLFEESDSPMLPLRQQIPNSVGTMAAISAVNTPPESTITSGSSASDSPSDPTSTASSVPIPTRRLTQQPSVSDDTASPALSVLSSSNTSPLPGIRKEQVNEKKKTSDPVLRYGLRRCLIVDDTVINVKILCRLLQGFNCDTATNGVEAVNTVRSLLAAEPANSQRQYDVILTDIIMPVMDGFQAASEIRLLEQSYGLPQTPIIAITANAMAQDQLKCTEAGMKFLAKPFVRDDLYRVLDSLWLKTK